MDKNSAKNSTELEKIKHRSRLMYFGGIGCLIFIVLLLALVIIFFNMILKLMTSL